MGPPAKPPCLRTQESYRYFGNGESFVMKIHPEFKVFRWTHENNLFVLANPDHLAFGGERLCTPLDVAFCRDLDECVFGRWGRVRVVFRRVFRAGHVWT
jgi:TLD